LLAPELAAARQVRRYVVSACEGLAEETTEVAQLLATELFSNAVRHGEGIVMLVVRRDDGVLRVEVADEGADEPVVVQSATLKEGGLGLRLVAAMAREWGVVRHADGKSGKRVWFTIE
jgi:anti-sigma regulatory factor (Ser/Thr protein kinase)